MVGPEKLLAHFKRYVEFKKSPVASGDDKILNRILKACAGARTLAEIEAKTRFLFFADDAIDYDEKAVNKVLMKNDGLTVLAEVRKRLAALDDVTSEAIENILRTLAEELSVGLGKVAQPLRVAICGNTISPPIFDSVDMLGMDNTLKRIDITLEKFSK
jgi:glutamyl-tRNA synthetase